MFTARSSFGDTAAGPAPPPPGDAGILLTPSAADGAVLRFAKKKRKKKKPAPSVPAGGKAGRKQAPPAAKRRGAGSGSFLRDFIGRHGLDGYTGQDWGRLAILVLALMVPLYYAFSAGGFFLEKRSYGELALLYLLVMGLIFSLRAEGRASRERLAVILLFAAYVFWILLSTAWSLSPADSFNEFNRGILYLAGMLTFFLFLARREWLGWLGAVFVVVVTIVAVDGILLKVLPEFMANYFNIDDVVRQLVEATGMTEENARLEVMFQKMDAFRTNRLSYPITYWNTMAVFMIMALPLTLRATADRTAPLYVRCLAAAVQVLLVAVIFFTVSRAGYMLTILIVLLFIFLSRERLHTALHAGLAALWAVLIVGVSALFLPAMVATEPTVRDRVDQGYWLGALILALMGAAALAQVFVARREDRYSLSEENARKVGIVVVVAAAVLTLASFVAFTYPSGGPVAWLQDQLSSATGPAESVSTAGERVFNLQSERYDEYAVSIKTLRENPLGGTGSGTWGIAWLKHRPYPVAVKDGHSWLFDSMAELGVVGTLLLVGFVAVFIHVAVRDLRRLGRSREREIYGAVLLACVALLLHSLIDWHWEMPVVTLSFFMFVGALLRYGILFHREQGNGDGPAAAGAVADTGVLGKLRDGWWVWLLGVGAVAMMVLTVMPVIAARRADSAQQHLDQARALEQSNRKQEARGWYEEALSIATGAQRYNLLDARLKLLAGDANTGLAATAADEASRRSYHEDAEAYYLEALELQPDNYETYHRLAEIYLRTEQLAKAADAVARSLILNPMDESLTRSLEERVRVLGGL